MWDRTCAWVRCLTLAEAAPGHTVANADGTAVVVDAANGLVPGPHHGPHRGPTGNPSSLSISSIYLCVRGRGVVWTWCPRERRSGGEGVAGPVVWPVVGPGVWPEVGPGVWRVVGPGGAGVAWIGRGAGPGARGLGWRGPAGPGVRGGGRPDYVQPHQSGPRQDFAPSIRIEFNRLR